MFKILNYKKIIILGLTLISFLFVGHKKANAANVTPTSYVNTIYSVMLCGPGSSLTLCVDPVVLGSETAGKSFDLSSITAGASAGGMGSLSTVPYGTTYSFFQVILDRQFTVTATGSDGDTTCATEANSGNGTASSGATPAIAVAGGTAAAQVIKIPDGSVLPTNMSGTDVIDGSVSANDEPAGVDSDTPYIKFRIALATPFTLKPGKMPNVQVAFSLTDAVNFANTGGGTCLVLPNAPAVAITFVE
jgi:hypothetical protein